MKIYIDGENFRHGLSQVLASEHLIPGSRQFFTFPVRALLHDVLAVEELEIIYYTSKIKLPRGYQPSAEIIKRAGEINTYNRQWTAQLLAQNIKLIKAGYLKVKTSEPCPNCKAVSDVLQEKGVDVRLAVDIISDIESSKKGTKIAILSSDSDLIPALQRAKDHNLYVIYLCFGQTVNRAISSTVNETVSIPKAKVTKFFKGNQNG